MNSHKFFHGIQPQFHSALQGRNPRFGTLPPSKVIYSCPFVVENYFFNNPYSILSTNAPRLASIILSLTPTVPHSSLPFVDSINTRVLAPVPLPESRMRT